MPEAPVRESPGGTVDGRQGRRAHCHIDAPRFGTFVISSSCVPDLADRKHTLCILRPSCHTAGLRDAKEGASSLVALPSGT
eukprot:15447794-Alexandrium_andersonii.AAC.1